MVVGVAGVCGWDEGSFAGAFYEFPAVVGFLLVVVPAEPVEEVVGGVVGLGPVGAVFVVESGSAVAAGGGAGGVEEVEGGLLVDVGSASVSVYADDLSAPGEHGGYEDIPVGFEVLDERYRDRSVAGDLA